MLKQLREKHAKAVTELKRMAEPLREREFKPEERAAYDKAKAEVDSLAARIKELVELEERERSLEQPAGDPLVGRGVVNPGEGRGNNGQDHPQITDEQRALALQGWCRHASRREVNERQQQAMQTCIGRTAGAGMYTDGGDLVIPLMNTRDFRSLVRERRTIGDNPMTLTTTAGGYAIPTGFMPQLERNMLAFGNVMQVAEVIRTDRGNDMPWPTISFTAMAGEAKAVNTAALDDKPTLGQVIFKAYKHDSKMILVPFELMEDSAFNLESILADGLGEVLGRLMNGKLTTGAGVGSGAPTGIVTCASAGVTAAGKTAITGDELLTLEHSVDPAYRDPAFNCGYMSNDGTVLKIKMMKDGQGRYLFPEMRLPEPRFDGFPWKVNQQMAAATDGLIPVIFGAFRKYKVRLVGNIRLAVLRERYAELDQTGFIAWVRFDGNVVDAGTAPIKKLTMAA